MLLIVLQKYPRSAAQIKALARYTGRLQDYCDDLDGVCDAAGNNLTAHTVYPQTWDTTAANWLETLLM